MAKHVHADLIKAWADGAEIERFSTTDGKWYPVADPSWHPEAKYRVKPTEKVLYIPDFKVTPVAESGLYKLFPMGNATPERTAFDSWKVTILQGRVTSVTLLDAI